MRRIKERDHFRHQSYQDFFVKRGDEVTVQTFVSKALPTTEITSL